MTVANELPEKVEPPHLMTHERWARMQAAAQSPQHKNLSHALEQSRKQQK